MKNLCLFLLGLVFFAWGCDGAQEFGPPSSQEQALVEEGAEQVAAAKIYVSDDGVNYSYSKNIGGSTVGGPSVAIDYDTGEAEIGYVRY